MQCQLDWLLVALIDKVVAVAIEWSHFMLRTGNTSGIESNTRIEGDNYTTKSNDKTIQFCYILDVSTVALVKSEFVVFDASKVLLDGTKYVFSFSLFCICFVFAFQCLVFFLQNLYNSSIHVFCFLIFA